MCNKHDSPCCREDESTKEQGLPEQTEEQQDYGCCGGFCSD